MIGVDIRLPNTPPLEMVKVPPGHVGHVSVPSLAFMAEHGDRLLDLGEAQRIGISDYRHDQALRRGDRDRDVDVLVIDDLVALDAGVDRGECPSAPGTRPWRKSS
jgi:hypothetical protein